MEYKRNSKCWNKVKNALENRSFIRLPSPNKIEPMLNDYLQSTHESECEREYNDGIEDIRTRNFDLEKKVDELELRVNDIRSRDIKFERDRANCETLFRRNSDLEKKADELTRKFNVLLSSHIKIEQENKDKREIMEKKSVGLKGEIGKLKDKIAVLDYVMADKMHAIGTKEDTQKEISTAPSFGFNDIEEMKKLISPNEIAIGIAILIFLVGFLIGMQIR